MVTSRRSRPLPSNWTVPLTVGVSSLVTWRVTTGAIGRSVSIFSSLVVVSVETFPAGSVTVAVTG